MTLSGSFSGADLYAISQRIGEVAVSLQASLGAMDFNLVSEALAPLSGSEFLTGAETVRFSRIAQHASRHHPTDSVGLLLSRVEGRIMGELVRRNDLPEEARDLFAERLAGRIPVTAEGIAEAHRRIRATWINGFLRRAGFQPVGYPRHVRRTRLMPFPALSEILGRMTYLKLESRQPVGSFKNRGATNFLVNALLAGKSPKHIRVGTASHGNHAQGVVRAAHNLGIRNVEVLLPHNASPLKIAQLKILGAHVELFSETFEEAEDEVRRRAAKDGNYLFLPAFDHSLVVTGQGTAGVEISQQMAVHGIDRYAVACPAGGGGLIAGVATFLAPRGVRVFGAESDAHPYVSRSFHARKIVVPEEIRHIDTVADGIALLKIGEAGFANLLENVAHVVAVPEVEVEAALMFLKERRIEAEGAAAVPIAALLFGALPLQRLGVAPNLPVVSILSGKNIDEGLLKDIEDRSHRRSWVQRRSEFQAMNSALETAGYLQNGAVRTLEDFKDAKGFLDQLVAHLPKDWDLIDGLSRLHFGPWRPDGEKDINATLRSLGGYQERWRGDKALSLLHPFGDRAARMAAGMALVRSGRKTLGDVVKTFGLKNVDSRFMTETAIVDLFLGRPDWLRRLWPGESPDALARRVESLKEQNRVIKASAAAFAALNAPGAFAAENGNLEERTRS